MASAAPHTRSSLRMLDIQHGVVIVPSIPFSEDPNQVWFESSNASDFLNRQQRKPDTFNAMPCKADRMLPSSGILAPGSPIYPKCLGPLALRDRRIGPPSVAARQSLVKHLVHRLPQIQGHTLRFSDQAPFSPKQVQPRRPERFTSVRVKPRPAHISPMDSKSFRCFRRPTWRL